MIYTFQISDGSAKSQSIINMLLALSKDYDFLKVLSEQNEEGEHELSPEQEKELDKRYKSFLKNPRNGKSWNEVKHTLLG